MPSCHLLEGVIVQRQGARFEPRPGDIVRREPASPSLSLEGGSFEDAEVPIDPGNRGDLEYVPVLPERRQHRRIDWNATMLHASRSDHESSAEQRALDIEHREHDMEQLL